jgi:hydroxymethylglutaryl-CoA lyase
VVTEDLVFMFEAMGVDTGVNIEALIETRKILQQALPNELVYGMLAEAGVPKNFRTHSDRVVK